VIFITRTSRRTRRNRKIALAALGAFNNLALEIPCRSGQASDFSFSPSDRRARGRNAARLTEISTMILYRDERIHGETGASIRGLNARIKVQSEKRDSIRAQRAYLRSAFDPLPFGDKRKSRPVLRAMLTAIIGIVTFAARARASAFGKFVFSFYPPKAISSHILPKRNSAFRRRSFDFAPATFK